MNNLYKEFLKVAAKYPDRKCITDNNLSFTYKEIKAKVESAILLIKAPPNTCGIIYLPKSIDLIVWQIAMNAKSIAFLTLEWGQENRKNSSIKKCAPSFVISANNNNNQIEIQTFNDFNIYPEECAYIIFSSGSSGEPKKIMLKDKGVINVVLQQAKITDMNEEKVFLWLLNSAFDASLSDIYMTLLSGGHLIVTQTKPSDIKLIGKLINLYQVSHTDVPPVVFSLWLKYYEKNPLLFLSLKHIVFGGEKSDEKLCKQLSNYFSLYNAYGPTETTICSSLQKIDHAWSAEDIGNPLTHVFYKIIENELHIGGEHCAIGYDNELLDKKFYFENNIKWFITGDLVKNINNKYLYSGRKDRQFKHNGQLICPEEIEASAQKCGANLARINYTNNKITLMYSGELSIENLFNLLPSWMMPHYFKEIADLEKNINQNWKLVG